MVCRRFAEPSHVGHVFGRKRNVGARFGGKGNRFWRRSRPSRVGACVSRCQPSASGGVVFVHFPLLGWETNLAAQNTVGSGMYAPQLLWVVRNRASASGEDSAYAGSSIIAPGCSVISAVADIEATACVTPDLLRDVGLMCCENGGMRYPVGWLNSL